MTLLLYAITGRAIYKGQARNEVVQEQLSDLNTPDEQEAIEPVESHPVVLTRTEISQKTEPVLPTATSSLPDSPSTRKFSDRRSSSSSIQHVEPITQPKFVPIRIPGFDDGTISPGSATLLAPPPRPKTPAMGNKANLARVSQITTTISTTPTMLYRPRSAVSLAVSFRTSANTHLQRYKSRTSGARTYAQVSFILFLVMLSVWVPSTANRVYGLLNGHRYHVPLNVAAAVVLPLQGFFNACIYVFTSRRELARLCTGRRLRHQRSLTLSEQAEDFARRSRPATKNSWYRAESRQEPTFAHGDDGSELERGRTSHR